MHTFEIEEKEDHKNKSILAAWQLNEEREALKILSERNNLNIIKAENYHLFKTIPHVQCLL